MGRRAGRVRGIPGSGVIQQAPDAFSARIGVGRAGDPRTGGRHAPKISALGQYFGPKQELVDLLEPALRAGRIKQQLIARRTFCRPRTTSFRPLPSSRSRRSPPTSTGRWTPVAWMSCCVPSSGGLDRATGRGAASAHDRGGVPELHRPCTTPRADRLLRQELRAPHSGQAPVTPPTSSASVRASHPVRASAFDASPRYGGRRWYCG